jgi:hypothetical protein
MSRIALPTLVLFATFPFAAGQTTALAAAGGGFIENHGQLDARVLYQLPGAGADVYLTREAMVFDVKDERSPTRSSGCAVSVRFVGANPGATVTGRDSLRALHHYFLGSDSARWSKDVPSYREIVYHELWPGVDLLLRQESGALRYDVALQPGADPRAAQFSIEGATQITHAGGLARLETPAGTVVHLAPGTLGSGWFATDPSPPRPRLRDTTHHPSPLVWSTFLGGTSDEIGWSIALDAQGDVLVTGLTISSKFPTTPGAYDRHYDGLGDVFVSKFDKTGRELLWSTLLGGTATNFDYGYAIALDAAGNPLVTGYTWSSDFPTTVGAYDRSFNGLVDAFVTKLSAKGDQLLWSTFLGGDDIDIGYSVAFDSQDRPVVTGRTLSSNFPTTPGAYDRNPHGEEDVFVTKLAADGSTLEWSTLVGGDFFDVGESVKLDANDRVIVLGYTASDDFPTTPGAFSRNFNGGLYDAFVFALNAGGDSLAWSTYLGGSDYEYGNDLAVDAAGDAVVVGSTASADFPTTPGAYDQSQNGGEDAFVSKVSHTNGSLVWSTVLGGSQGYLESAYGVALDGREIVVVGGTTASDFPTTLGAYDTKVRGMNDVFLSRLSTDGAHLLFSTLLGGLGDDFGNSVALDRGGNAFVTGVTGSPDFPTTPGAYQETYLGGDQDAFVLQIARPILQR